MKYKYFPKIDDGLLEREPDEQDNPYFVIEHILACREEGVDSDWHEEYIDKILTGLLFGTLNTDLGIIGGRGQGGDLPKWRLYHERIDMFLDGVHLGLGDDGVKPYADKKPDPVKGGITEGGIFIQLSKDYKPDDKEIGKIFSKKGALPSMRRPPKTDKK